VGLAMRSERPCAARRAGLVALVCGVAIMAARADGAPAEWKTYRSMEFGTKSPTRRHSS